MKQFISYVSFAYQSTVIGQELVVVFAIVYCLVFVSVPQGFGSSNRLVFPKPCSQNITLMMCL